MKIEHNHLVAAALAVVLLGGCAGSPAQESTGEYIDDTTLTSKVKTTLLQIRRSAGLASMWRPSKERSSSAGSPTPKRKGNGLSLWRAP